MVSVTLFGIIRDVIKRQCLGLSMNEGEKKKKKEQIISFCFKKMLLATNDALLLSNKTESISPKLTSQKGKENKEC